MRVVRGAADPWAERDPEASGVPAFLDANGTPASLLPGHGTWKTRNMPLLRVVPVGLFFAALSLAAAPMGCAAPTDDTVESASESAFTVDRGDRFVVSATPEKIVLKKKVDKTTFPFDEASLRGKAILIHPVDKRAETGVYARAVAVRASGDTYVIDGRPLTLPEMEAMTEDDIVRIYIDPKRPVRRSLTDTLEPSTVHLAPALPPSLQPHVPPSLEAIAFGDTGKVEAKLTLGETDFFSPQVKVSHRIDEVTFEPEALVDWSESRGLELGFRADFAWKSTLSITGTASQEIYRSQSLVSPPVIVTVPIGAALVPVSLTASTAVVCRAVVEGPVEAKVTLEARAKLGGSMLVDPALSKAPDEWIGVGRWDPTADGTASATLSGAPMVKTKIDCVVPRIDLKAFVGGIAGPYLAVKPTAVLEPGAASFKTVIAAGVGAQMLGIPASVEVHLYTWRP